MESIMQIDVGQIDSWLGLIIRVAVTVLAVLAFVWRVIRAPIMEQINGLGTRVNASTESCATLGAKVGSLERQHELMSFQQQANSERMGKLEGKLDKVDDNISKFRDHSGSEESEIKERLAGIESRMTIFSEIRDALLTIAKNSGKTP